MDLFTLLCVGSILLLLLLLLPVNFDTLAYKLTLTQTISAQKNVTGSDYSPISNGTTISKSVSVGTTVANAAVGGGDELYSAISSISSSSSVSLDMTAFTDFLNQASASFTRIKALVLRLLSATDDATNGTAAASITVDGTVANALLSASGTGWLTNATSKIDVPNGGFHAFGTPAAAGIAVSGTVKIIKIINNDGSLSAKAQLTGAGGST